jgi:hypothetical protein
LKLSLGSPGFTLWLIKLHQEAWNVSNPDLNKMVILLLISRNISKYQTWICMFVSALI